MPSKKTKRCKTHTMRSSSLARPPLGQRFVWPISMLKTEPSLRLRWKENGAHGNASALWRSSPRNKLHSFPKDAQVIGTRWVHVDKASKSRAMAMALRKKTGKTVEQIEKEHPFEAKSRMVVQVVKSKIPRPRRRHLGLGVHRTGCQAEALSKPPIDRAREVVLSSPHRFAWLGRATDPTRRPRQCVHGGATDGQAN